MQVFEDTPIVALSARRAESTDGRLSTTCHLNQKPDSYVFVGFTLQTVETCRSAASMSGGR